MLVSSIVVIQWVMLLQVPHPAKPARAANFLGEERGGAGRVLSGLGWDAAGIGNGEVLKCGKFGMLSFFWGGGRAVCAVCARVEGGDVYDGVWVMVMVMVMVVVMGEFG